MQKTFHVLLVLQPSLFVRVLRTTRYSEAATIAQNIATHNEAFLQHDSLTLLQLIMLTIVFYAELSRRPEAIIYKPNLDLSNKHYFERYVEWSVPAVSSLDECYSSTSLRRANDGEPENTQNCIAAASLCH